MFEMVFSSFDLLSSRLAGWEGKICAILNNEYEK